MGNNRLHGYLLDGEESIRVNESKRRTRGARWMSSGVHGGNAG
jgi:hypothetical protein